MSDAFWLGAAAVANVVAAGAITYQAIETRVLAKETRDEIASSQAIQLETVKARLDARGPELAITTRFLNQRTLIGPPATHLDWDITYHDWENDTDSGPGVDADSGMASMLALTFAGRLTNNADRAVEVRLDPPLAFDDAFKNLPATSVSAKVLGPGEFADFTFLAVGTVSEWASNADLWGNRDPSVYPFHVPGKVTADDRLDNGARDEWELIIAGAPLRTVAPESRSFERIDAVEGTESVFVLIPPAARTYYISKREGTVLGATVDAAQATCLPWWTRAYRKAIRGSGLQPEGSGHAG